MPGLEVTLRTLRPGDRDEVARVLGSTSAFQPHEIAVGLELVDESLDPGPSTDYGWFLAERDGRVVGFACYGPVPLTTGTFDLYWIAVERESQGTGVARALDDAVTGAIREQGGRWLLAETSSTSPYGPAQAFYDKRGYRLLGRIEDFYRVGDDRLTFGKRLDQG